MAPARIVHRSAALGLALGLVASSSRATTHPETSPAEVEPSSPSFAPEVPSISALPPLEADEELGNRHDAGPFARHKFRLSMLVGTSSTNRGSYLILGGGIGYFLVDGLEAGIDYEDWLLGEPIVHRLSPEARYVFHFVSIVKPYVGAFYRHTFVNDSADLDHVGARGGLYYVPPTGKFYLGGGAAFERLLNCKSGALVDCNAMYPEVLVGISL
jgi:hypothetical protein